MSLEVIFSRTETRENDPTTKNTHRENRALFEKFYLVVSLSVSSSRAPRGPKTARNCPILDSNSKRAANSNAPIVRARGYRIRRDQSEKRQKDGDGEQKSERYSLERKERNERAEKTRSNAHLRTLLREDFLFCSELLFKGGGKNPYGYNGQKNAPPQKSKLPEKITTFYLPTISYVDSS